MFLVLYVVFVKILKAGGDIPHFGTYLLLGIVLWNFFAEVTTGSIGAIVGKGDLLRKVNFPRYVIILASSISALINLLLSLVVVFVFMLITGVEISPLAVLFPLLLVELFLFSLAIGFFLSALFVKFRDIGFIWEIVMQGAFFATPIMYDYAFITNKSMLLGKILMMNPITQLMQDARYMLITPESATLHSLFSGWVYYIIPLTIVLVVMVVSGYYFKKRSPNFAEEV